MFSTAPARHLSAEQHLLYVLAGYAVAVIATRSFLEWAGYPQVATGQFHIAHVLWGGLLLFLASLILLIWRGRGIYRIASLLTGVGFGLFIDEVGKFITRNNDYFYPLAAPIIYAFFLLTLLIYVRLRRSRSHESASSVHYILDLLEQAVDHSLSAQEYEAIRTRLQSEAQSIQARPARLAAHALAFLEVDYLDRRTSDVQEQQGWRVRLELLGDHWFTQRRLKQALTLGFAMLAIRGVLSAIAALLFVISIWNPERWVQMGAQSTPLSAGGPFTVAHLLLVSATMTLEGILGGLFLAATGLMVAGRVRNGLRLGYWGLLFSLTGIHFLIFYFMQFDAILTTLLQFSLLLGVIHYRRRWLLP